MLDFHLIALKHSMTCFFNSYIRDMNLPYLEDQKCFEITANGETHLVAVDFYSSVGVHQFSNAHELLSLAEKICAGTQLQARLHNSIENMVLSLKHSEKEIHKLYQGNFDFIKAEQGLLVGHSFHPTPKSRDEFTADDLILYAPEFQASFPLHWLLVKEELIYQERSQASGNRNWQQELFKKEVPAGFIPFPVHPWQHQVLLNDSTIQKYLKDELILEAGNSEENWIATSSMRSLYHADSPFMLKFSMSVRMTNSIRHMQKKEVSRGMQVQDAFYTSAGKEFSLRFPQFKIMHEPGFMAILDESGVVMPQTVALLRENPFVNDSTSVAVLATLTQAHPIEGKNLIAQCLKQDISGIRWFDAFLDHAIVPLLIAQADYGIMLGAHQQNLLIKLQDGLPVGSYFRDCQGTGFSNLGKELLLPEMPDAEKFLAHLVPEEAALSLFSYYLIINSVFNTIAALAQVSPYSEKDFIVSFVSRLNELKNQVKDPSVINHLLTSKSLNQKGNFRCSIQSINENTTENPLAIYNSIQNPFYLESSL